MKRVVVLLLALFLFAPPVLAQEPGKGAINGQVVNKTPGTGVVAQQPVDLITYQGGAEKGRAKVNTDAEGR
ncbi:MAG: hypothetical protein HY664_03255, partial [Chloroflexi bacterium]|nr:hypothetical protein [Chloroflexota bacterium]